MKILVTGANGYLGQGVVKHLLDKGHVVVAADFNTNSVDERACRIECNLFEIDNPYLFFGCPEILVHMAWRDGFVHFADSHLNDLPLHCNFIRKMSETGIRTIAAIGTMHEIGFHEGCIRDDTPCNPITPYGISKNALREYSQVLCQRNNKLFMWLRGFYIVGNTRYGSSVFSKIVEDEYSGKKEFPFTHGQNQFDFIDYDVFCEMIAKSITQTNIAGIINICSGRPEKLADRVERFISENKYAIRLKYGVYPERADESKAVWGDSRKIDLIMKRK